MNNDTNTTAPAAPRSFADRARFSAMREGAPIMPDRPTDTSRNGMRGPRPSPRRRAIR